MIEIIIFIMAILLIVIPLKLNKRKVIKNKSILPMWIIMVFVTLLGLLFLALKPLIDIGFLPNYKFFSGDFGELTGILSLNFGQALFIGGLVGIFFEIGSVKRYFEQRISDILINDEYLKNQKNEELMRLRLRATQNIFEKKSLTVDPKLAKLDQEICEAFTEPYFEYFQESSNCEISNDKKYITKIVRTRFKLINPTMENINFHDFYKPKIRFKGIEGVDHKNIRSLDTFEIKIDKGEFISLKEKVVIDPIIETPINGDDNYTITTEVKYTGLALNTLTFQNTLEARIIETRKIPIDDLNYSFRMDHLVQNFKISLVFEGDPVDLIGNIYGTMTNPRRGIFIDRDSNSISLESKEWMLKGNGAFINIIPKK